jgi:hypothetical protein
MCEPNRQNSIEPSLSGSVGFCTGPSGTPVVGPAAGGTNAAQQQLNGKHMGDGAELPDGIAEWLLHCRPLKSWFDGWAGAEGLDEGEKNETQNHPQLGEEQAQVVADRAEDGIDSVAGAAFEIATPETTFRLHVADHGLDGGTTSELAFDAAERGIIEGTGFRPTRRTIRPAIWKRILSCS